MKKISSNIHIVFHLVLKNMWKTIFFNFIYYLVLEIKSSQLDDSSNYSHKSNLRVISLGLLIHSM